ncbi:TlpA family protein disulfide reductase [Billgrantia antri]|uniref:TlpA family protein disulfide reductase n=1 Tax=Billgrantia antri TaxID=2846777 RepID=UPI003B22722D
MNPLERSLAIGPFGITLGQLLLAVSVVFAVGVGAWLGRHRQVKVGDILLNALLIGMASARIAFVARYWESYATFWSWFDIRDRGFEPMVGLLVALLYLGWRIWRHPSERRPLGIAFACGALLWSMTAGAMSLMTPRGANLPGMPLVGLDGETASLPDVLSREGRPMVVNLWASWCPPCRREMPMLEEAQQQRDDITFVFINQGESLKEIQAFLRRETLELEHVYRDLGTEVGREVGAMAMPTTLYYDDEGELVDTHLGELSRATLQRDLERLE